MTTDAELIEAFVATFVRFDNSISYTHSNPPPPEFHQGIDPEDWNCIRWSPARIGSSHELLQPVRDRIGRSLPKLYEQLVLNYRWPELSLHRIRLKANVPGPDLAPLFNELFRDPAFESTLIANFYLPFAFGGEGDEFSYDPICFDLNSLTADGDCRIIRFEHEEILCNNRIGESWELWPSFRVAMLDTVLAVNDLP